MKNLVFRSGKPVWSNACVGNNGSPDYFEYSKGYSRAANILLDKVIEADGSIPVDFMVYPICFNMRHSVELRLKDIIYKLKVIAELRSKALTFNQDTSHDIGEIWTFFKESASELDNRYLALIESLDEKITAFVKVDSSGQTFRYPYSNESQKHLTEISNISLHLLKVVFEELEQKLDSLYELNERLIEEYRLNTFTQNLSRYDCFAIVKVLPNKHEWSNSLKPIKEQIKRDYGIGSKEFGLLLSKIQENYELAYEIGIQLDLLGVVEGELSEFVNDWIEFRTNVIQTYEADGLSFVGSSDINLDEFSEYLIACSKYEEKYKSIVTEKYVAGIRALYYFAEDFKYSEYYQECYEVEITRFNQSKFQDPNNLLIELMHIFKKPNFLQQVIKSLEALRYIELSDSYRQKLIQF